MASGSMSKHVAKDGKTTWRVRVDLYDPITGRRRQPQRTYPTKREAERGLRDWLRSIEEGTYVERSRQTVADYLSWWLDDCAAHRVKPTTLASYRWLCSTYIVPQLGAIEVQKLGPQQLQSFYSWALGRNLSARTVRYLHSILHNALAEALRLGLGARNVTEAVTPPRAVRHEAHAWSPEEVQRFLGAAQHDSLWPLWLLAVHTGLRRSELLGLRWADVDLGPGDSGQSSGVSGTLQVRQSVVLVGNSLVIQEGAKRGGHGLRLASVCVSALREHRTRQLELRLLLGPLWGGSRQSSGVSRQQDLDLIFTQEGAPVHPTTLGRHFRALQGEAGCTPLPFHGLRHTHATILMTAGVHPKVVSERLGHADIGITLRTYSHVLPALDAQAAEVFAAAVTPPAEPEAQSTTPG